jgi:hypothetical protein
VKNSDPRRADGTVNASWGTNGVYGGATSSGMAKPHYGTETVADWACADDCPVAELDRQSGSSSNDGHPRRNTTALGRMNDDGWVPSLTVSPGYGDMGGASRFFPTFRYQAKADTAERNIGLPHGERNMHPTCKPIELCQWLVKLVTPPGGIVLDPFAGSGTTGMAALREGFRFLGVEQDAEHAATARLRIEGDAPLLNAPTEILPVPTPPVIPEPDHAQEAML